MLAPDDIGPSLNSLKKFYVNTIASDKLATMNRTLNVYQLKNEAPWIADLREKAKLLCKNGVAWGSEKVKIIPNVLDPFVQYKILFSSVAKLLPGATSGDLAADFLQRLEDQVDKNIQSTHVANQGYSRWIEAVKLNIDLLGECIEEAWKDLGSSEKKIIQFSQEIIKTQNNIEELEGVITPSSISEGTIGGIKDVASNLASMSYSVIVNGYSISYLSVGVMFFTLGKTFYDIFSTADNLHNEIEDLSKYGLELTYEEQALAQTKAALQLVYNLKSLIEQQVNSLDELENFWKNEKRNINTVKDEFRLDKHYNPENAEILQLGIAESVWNSLETAAKGLEDKFGDGIASNTEIDIGK